jgi:hypothetical protein
MASAARSEPVPAAKSFVNWFPGHMCAASLLLAPCPPLQMLFFFFFFFFHSRAASPQGQSQAADGGAHA